MPDLSITAKREYYLELASALPPPVLDQPDYRERRETTAYEVFEALRPGDAYEAHLAVRIVLCGARAVECLRLAAIHHEDFAKMTRCCAQAASMMREERLAKRTLEREQKLRLTVEAVAAAAGTRTEYSATESTLPPRAEPEAAPPSVETSAAAPSPALDPPSATPMRPAATRTAPAPVPAGSAPPPSPEAIAKAEAFARDEIIAAVQIRRDRGVTPRNQAYFRHVAFPTDPAVIDALVRGTTALLTVLDEVDGDALDTELDEAA